VLSSAIVAGSLNGVRELGSRCFEMRDQDRAVGRRRADRAVAPRDDLPRGAAQRALAMRTEAVKLGAEQHVEHARRALGRADLRMTVSVESVRQSIAP
jgi:hypothetical protein